MARAEVGAPMGDLAMCNLLRLEVHHLHAQAIEALLGPVADERGAIFESVIEGRNGGGIAQGGQGPDGLNADGGICRRRRLGQCRDGAGSAGCQSVGGQPHRERLAAFEGIGQIGDRLRCGGLTQTKGGALADRGGIIAKTCPQGGARFGQVDFTQAASRPPSSVGVGSLEHG